MRIAINGLSAQVGGTITYLSNLLPALGNIDSRNSYFVFIRRNSKDKLARLPLPVNFTLIPIEIHGLLHRIFFEQCVLPFFLKHLSIDLLYAPSEIAPILSPCKVVLGLRNPNVYTDLRIPWPLSYRIRFAIMKILTRYSALKANKVISTSASWREAMAEKLSINLDKMIVIHHGLSDSFRNIGRDRLKNRDHGSLENEYILSVSTIYRYKNYLNLIKAFALLQKKGATKLQLIIIGGNNYDLPYYRQMVEEIVANQLQEKIVLLGNVDYASISSYYRNALISVFPSYLETFGHPAIEAMATGVPLAVSDIPVFKEICGDGAAYFDPFDVNDIAAVIERLVTNADLRASLARKGFEQSQLFSWDRTARLMLQTFEELENK